VKAQCTKLRADEKNEIALSMTFCCDTYAAEWKHKPSVVTQLSIRFYCLLHVSTFRKPSSGNENIYKER